ncbi:7tm 6 domain containing protein, partial [Asbolus verrucosus]
MEKFDWKLTIERNIGMLKIVGLWPAGDDTYKPDLYTLYAIISITVFVLGHNFCQSFNIIYILDDLEALTATIFVSLTEMLAILKSYYLIRNMGILKQLMVTLTSDMFQPKNQNQKSLVKSSLNFWKSVYTVFSLMTLSTIFFWTTFPILDGSVREHRLPFLACFAQNSNQFFNWIVLSAISIGMTMFQLTVVALFSSEFYSYLFYANAIVVEIFMYCWFGNEVEVKSSRFLYAVFEADWTEASLEVKKNLVFFTLRCQKPIKVSALNLFYLTLNTFMK